MVNCGASRGLTRCAAGRRRDCCACRPPGPMRQSGHGSPVMAVRSWQSGLSRGVVVLPRADEAELDCQPHAISLLGAVRVDLDDVLHMTAHTRLTEAQRPGDLPESTAECLEAQ